MHSEKRSPFLSFVNRVDVNVDVNVVMDEVTDVSIFSYKLTSMKYLFQASFLSTCLISFKYCRSSPENTSYEIDEYGIV